MENITLAIDGNSISCPKGSSIFDAAQGNGIRIPNLCYHHSLKPFGACRLCLVEDEKTGRLMASCVTPAAQDMAMLTDSPRIIKHRRNIVRLMLAEHPESCVVCNKGNRCKLRQIAAKLGIGETNLYPMPNYKMLEQANPFIIRDHSKCILCGKCVRADHELVVTGAIDYSLRGFKSRPVTAHDLPLEHSSCTFCGTCVSICPTGALSPKSEYIGTPERESVSICGFCGIGCSLSMGAEGEKIVDVNPAHLKKSVNDATLCVRGHFAHDFLNSRDRLSQPLIRKDNELIPASWDEALKMVADRFMDIQEKAGPQSLAFLGSSKCTNEENYLFQKIARVVFKTNNVDNGGYITGRHFLSMIEGRTDPGGRFNFFAGPLAGLEKAEVIFVLGADPDHSAPVVSYYLKRGTRNGIPMIIASPRRTELVNFCSTWLHLSNGSNCQQHNLDQTYLELINGLSALLVEEEAYDHSFIERFTEGFSNYKDSLSSIDINRISRITGIDTENLQDAVKLLKGKKIAFVIGNGLLLQKYNSQSMEALLNLSLMTGSIGYEGAGFYLLAAENNLIGAWDMGTVPDALPGRHFLKDESSRKLWEEAWKAEIPPDPGFNMVQMIKAAEEKNLKALYIMGENPLRSLPQTDRVLKALQNLDFLVVQDILAGETTSIADVVLPGSAFSEKGGSFTNIEGKIQTFSPVVSPPEGAKSDLEILGLLSEKMEHTGYGNTPEKVR
ncbi:MAG: molybdopterin-dependent oxidoreductase, partial [Deltaproteobacteria bacterium]|nr:molybdopterin-dependent oxidoreductase [Deltaproteobacteria bacterium]